MELHKLLRLLKQTYPTAYISVGVDYDMPSLGQDILHEYTLYVHAGAFILSETFENFKDLRAYIFKHCGVLTINELTKIWGSEGGTDLEVR